LGRRDAEAAKTGAAMTLDAALAKGKSWDAQGNRAKKGRDNALKC
jgi:hypothetical protein